MTTTDNSIAEQRARMPGGTHKVLDRRTVEHGNKNILPYLKEGMIVLDVGCGSGSITNGIAKRIGAGRVVGVDSSKELISMAREKYRGTSNLSFVEADILQYETSIRFDFISTARTLQWLNNPLSVILKMKSLLKKGGYISALDYNHEKIEWLPTPPQSMLRFYAAFLDWRAQAGMNNRIADNLEGMFSDCGLSNIQLTDETEVSNKSDIDFLDAARIWKIAAETRGHQLVSDGYITENERLEAIREYDYWLATEAISMKMYLRSATGQNQ